MSVVHHVFRGERLQAFSDAVFAIVATIMAIPLKLEQKDLHADFVLKDYLYHLYPRFLVYLFAFILVVDTWYSHARIFSVVEQVDDVILWLNLLSLLFISFLPYGMSLISHFQDSRPEGFSVAVSTCSTIIILTGVAMVIMVLYAFRKQALLHPELAGNTKIRSLKIGLLITLAVNPLLAIVAELFLISKKTEVVSLVFFYSMGLTSFAVRSIIHFYHQRKQYTLPEFATSIFRTVANKSRTEAFSNGVFSIVATLIVLDFTTQIPSSDDVEHSHNGNLKKALSFQRFIYLAYLASFCIVGLLWFVQYGMFHFIKKITPTLSFVNTLTLCLIGGIPFISSIYVTFADEASWENAYYTRENELVAIRASVVLVFLVGVSQLVFWTVALNFKTECLYEEVDRYPAEPLVFVKIMIFPAISGLLFGLTFTEQVSVKHVYGAMIIVTPFIFLIIKMAFSIHEHCRKRVTQHVSSVKRKLFVRNYCSTRSSPINTATVVSPEQVPLNTADS